MRIAFIQDFWQEFYGIMNLSAVLKKQGHECAVFIKEGEADLISTVIAFKPDIIGFTLTTGLHTWAVRTAREIKKKTNAVIIFGGAHPTVMPEVIEQDGVDVVCRGEGEGALCELADNLKEGRDITGIQNLWVKKNGAIYKNEMRQLITDLDSLPYPDWSIYYKYNFLYTKKTRTFMGSRGCPYNCTFCTNHIYAELYKGHGSFFRQRSPEKLIREIEVQRKILNFNIITFDDEIFILNKKWAADFLKLYKQRINLPFFCGVRVDLVTDEIVELLKEHGCYGLSFGIESGSEYIRNEIGGKGIRNDQIIRASAVVKKYGIILRTTNMFALPGETFENALETVTLNIACKVDHPFAYIYQPLPKTQMVAYAQAHGFLDKNFDFDTIESIHLNKSILILKNKNEIVNLQKFFYCAVKFPFLLPLIRMLVKLPGNIMYNIVFQMSLVHNYARYKRLSFFKVFMLGLNMLFGRYIARVNFKKRKINNAYPIY